MVDGVPDDDVSPILLLEEEFWTIAPVGPTEVDWWCWWLLLLLLF